MQTLAELDSSLQTIEKFEELLGSFDPMNLTNYSKHFGKVNQPGSFIHYLNNKTDGLNAKKRITSAFAGFTFDVQDERADLVCLIITSVKLIVTKTDKNTNDFTAIETENDPNRARSLVKLIFSAITKTASDRTLLVNSFNRLIALQKTAITQAIATEKSSLKTVAVANKFARLASAKLKQDHYLQATTAYNESIAEDRASASKRKTNLYLGAAALATGGSAAIALSTLLQFGPQLAILASLNLPPVALAAIAVTGVAMLAAAAYMAYRTYKPAPISPVGTASDALVVTNPVASYSNFLTPTLATAGLSLVGFSALVQFSPNVALFMGLHLTPAALISVAAVGVLLLSVSLYRACKAYAQSRADATAATVVVSADATTCMQRLSQYTNFCCKLFKRTTPESVATRPSGHIAINQV